MKKLFLIFPILFIALGIYYLLRTNTATLENYISSWLSEREVSAPDLTCQMNKVASRTGYCTFSLESHEISALKSKLKLIEGGSLPYRKEGCRTLPGLSTEESYVPEVDPGPIFSGNSRSSLNRILYSRSANVFCLDVEFPFG